MTGAETVAAQLDDREARLLHLGDRLDAANDAVRAALAEGDEREHATQLLERAWLLMAIRELHGRYTMLGRTWDQLMVRDVELALQVARCPRR